MPYLHATDGTRLYYEETGSGTPLIFVHEFGGDPNLLPSMIERARARNEPVKVF